MLRAASTIRALQALNHTLIYTFGVMDTLHVYQSLSDMISIVIWEAALLDKCVKRNNENYQESEFPDQAATGEWQVGDKGCIKREGFPEGIPVWKSFSFHFWPSAESPLGHRWTLSPEEYKVGNGAGNYYLGEPCFVGILPGRRTKCVDRYAIKVIPSKRRVGNIPINRFGITTA